MHRALRGAADQRSALPDRSHGPTAGQCGPSLVRADRRGNGVPHSYGPTAGATGSRIRRADRWSAALRPGTTIADECTAPCAVQPTNGRLYRMVLTGRPPGNVVPHWYGPTTGATWSRIRTGRPPGRRGPAFVEPTVGRLLFVPAPRSPMNAPRRARCSRPTVGSTGVSSRSAPRRTRPAPSTRAWPRVRCTGTPADCWRPIRRSSAPRRCNW